MIEAHFQEKTTQSSEELKRQAALEMFGQRYNISKLILDQDGNVRLKLMSW